VITGIDDVLQAEESLANVIADSIMPAMMPDIEIVTFETRELLVIKVAHWSGPFYLKTEGPEEGVYVRLGSTNRKAGHEILAELHRTKRRVSFDQEPCTELSEDDLDMAKAESVFNSVNRSIDKHKLESLGLVVPYAGRKTVSNGCLILFGKEIHRNRFFPDARVSCARFRGTDKTQFIDRLDIEGGILDAVQDVPKFTRRNTRLFTKIESFKREDIPAFPEVAIREVLVNACGAGGYPEPEWAELGYALRVIFYPHPEVGEMEKLDVPVNVPGNVPVNDRQKWFLQQIGKNIRVLSSNIATHWDVSQKTAKRDIADLKRKELIEFLGAPKNGYYRLKSGRLK